MTIKQLDKIYDIALAAMFFFTGILFGSKSNWWLLPWFIAFIVSIVVGRMKRKQMTES